MWKLLSPTPEEKELILMGLESVQISRDGYYEKGGRRIWLAGNGNGGFEQAVVYSPRALEELRRGGEWACALPHGDGCRISVADTDSFQAASTLEGALVMNFANPRRPGGGFLYGAKAQEESLCRASTLYASLSSQAAAEMYAYNVGQNAPLDSGHMILSPEVWVFRDHEGALLDVPFCVAVITVPAPDRAGRASRVPRSEGNRVMKDRLRGMFTVAAGNGYRSLVLGAWGCGVFGNDPRDVAGCFYEVLVREGFRSYFDRIVFAIYHDREKQNIFQEIFA